MKLRRIAVWITICLLLLPSALGAQQRVYDDAELFTFSERQNLEAKIAEFQSETGMDFVILTSDEAHRGVSSEAVADNFYDEGDFGLDADNSGVLYYIDMYERYQHISTTGVMIDYMTDARIRSAIDACTSNLSSGSYASAAEAMLSRVRSAIQQGIPEGQYRYDTLTGQRLSSHQRALTPMHLLISAAVALAVFLIFTMTVARRYQLKGSTYRYQYSANSDLQMTAKDDTFLRTTTHSMPKPPPSSNNGGGSGGGSGVHIGGSGTSHGGGGGRF